MTMLTFREEFEILSNLSQKFLVMLIMSGPFSFSAEAEMNLKMMKIAVTFGRDGGDSL